MATQYPAGEPCCGCGVAVGEKHSDGCDHAHCVECGGQREMCLMDGIHGNAPIGVWQGEDVTDIAAREFGFYHPFIDDGEEIVVEDDFRVRSELAWSAVEQKFVAHTATDVRSDGSTRWLVDRD